MGCCYSWFCDSEGSSSSGGDRNERTHLLADPVANGGPVGVARCAGEVGQGGAGGPGAASCEEAGDGRTDEQTALNRILQETATNVIDVAALEAHNLQHHEYADRYRHYQAAAGAVCLRNRAEITAKVRGTLLKDVPYPEKILQMSPICTEALHLITYAVSKAVTAIADIKVEHKEDLVVPFHIPG